MQQASAQWIGIFISGALGATALLWNVFKHLSDRRHAERQRLRDRIELIEIKVWSFVTDVQRGICASLTVHNCGIPDVYIESVKLVCRPYVLSDGSKPKWDETSVPLRSRGKSDEPLKPGAAREYLLYFVGDIELSHAIAQHRCWIEVHSHAGEIGRLGSEEVAPILKLLVERERFGKAG